MPAGAGGEGLDIGEGAIEQVEEWAEVVQQHLAGRRRLHAPVVPAKEGSAKPGFHIGNAAAEGRERQVLALGGTREAALLDRGLEDPQRDEIQTEGGPGQWRSWHDALP